MKWVDQFPSIWTWISPLTPIPLWNFLGLWPLTPWNSQFPQRLGYWYFLEPCNLDLIKQRSQDNDNDWVLVALIAVSGLNCMDTALRGRTKSMWRRFWQPLYGPCMTSEHSTTAVSQSWGGKKTRMPGEKPSESGSDWPLTHLTYAPGRNQTRVIVVGGVNANVLCHPDMTRNNHISTLIQNRLLIHQVTKPFLALNKYHQNQVKDFN